MKALQIFYDYYEYPDGITNLDDFVKCYCTGHIQDRKETYSKENPNGKAGREMGGATNGGGRPPLPEDELKVEEPAILPNSTGDLSPRGKQEEAGELPAPEGGGDVGDILSGLGE